MVQLVKSALLDADGNLFDNQPIIKVAVTSALSLKDCDRVLENWQALKGLTLRGQYDWIVEDCPDFGRDIDFGSFAGKVSEGYLTHVAEIKYRPGAEELLDRLVERDIPHAVFSNAPPHLLDAGAEAIGLKDRGIPVWSAKALTGFTKDKPDAYRAALDTLASKFALSVNPESCLFVDDSLSSIDAALEAGLISAHFPLPDDPKRSDNPECITIERPEDLAALIP